jgi:hypothetical protein
MDQSVLITIEGTEFKLEERDYSGSELRKLAGLPEKDKLVLEEADGTETAVPPAMKVKLVAGSNLFVSHRHRRG